MHPDFYMDGETFVVDFHSHPPSIGLFISSYQNI